MKIIVTGVKGQLGYDVVRELTSRGYEDVLGIDIEDLNITDQDAVYNFFKLNKPDVIVHCAAYTAVDKAEDDINTCMRVNVTGTQNLLNQARNNGAKFIYISTDYVFDGDEKTPYEISDTPNPESVYGVTKCLGEKETILYEKHFIVRISWVFGKNGNNFVKTMLRLGKERESINVVNDQIGSPTYTFDLSRLLVDMLESESYGTYHATNEGTCTWYEFTKEIFRLANISTSVNPILTVDYPTKAKRPKNSVMSKKSLDDKGFKRLPSWQDALKRYLEEIEVI